MDILFIISLVIVYLMLAPFFNAYMQSVGRKRDNYRICEYVQLYKLDDLEHKVLHKIHYSNSNLLDIKKRYINLSEIELKEILDKYCRLKVLDQKFIRYFASIDNLLSLDIPNLPEWEIRILTFFWEELDTHSYTYKELKQKFTGVTEERVVNTMKRLCNVGIVKMNEEGIYDVVPYEIKEAIWRMQRIIKEDQNNE